MRSDWNDAVLYFYEAESLAAELSDETIKPYTDFALASSYLLRSLMLHLPLCVAQLFTQLVINLSCRIAAGQLQ